MFLPDNPWNEDISRWSVQSNSQNIIASLTICRLKAGRLGAATKSWFAPRWPKTNEPSQGVALRGAQAASGLCCNGIQSIRAARRTDGLVSDEAGRSK